LNITKQHGHLPHTQECGRHRTDTQRISIHGGIHPSLTRRKMIGGDRDPWVETHLPALKRRAKFNRRYATGGIGGIVIRGLKPTAKFICRYAAKMRLQPTTNGPHPRVSVPRPMFPPHGLWVSALRPRVSVPRRRYPKIRIVVCGQSRHRRVEIPSRRVATIEFSRGFQPTDHVAPIGSRRVSDG